MSSPSIEVPLQDETTQLLQFLYACPVGLIEINASGEIGMMNPFAMQLLLPISRPSAVYNLFEIFEAFAPELRNLLDAYSPSQGTICDSHRIVIKAAAVEKGAEARVFSCTLVKISGSRFMVCLADVSRQVAQERRLKQAETWFSSLLDGVNDFAVVSLDATGRIDGANSSVLAQTGHHGCDLVGQTLDVFVAPGAARDSLHVEEQLALAARDGWHLTEVDHGRPNGETYWCQQLIAVRSISEGHQGRSISGYTVVLRDVRRRESDADALTHMLRRDHLTGAYNRSHFFELAERECLRSRRYHQALSLIALDIDHFKKVNDTYGHPAGDKALSVFASVCAKLLRPTDTFARLGGEEFVILLPSTDLSEAFQLAERIRVAITRATVEVAGKVLHLSASFGCAEFAGEGTTHHELLGAADEALYRAKHQGRNRVVLAATQAVSAERH